MTFAAYSRCSINSAVRVHCCPGLCDLVGPTGHGVDIAIASARNGKIVLSPPRESYRVATTSLAVSIVCAGNLEVWCSRQARNGAACVK